MAGMVMTNRTGTIDNSMIAMNPVNGDSAPDETVAGYGPDVPFTFTFPAAGEYRSGCRSNVITHCLRSRSSIDVVDESSVQGMRP